jgi:hypothetical protein
MLIMPAVFFLMGLSRLALGGRTIDLLLAWAVSAALFAAIALYTGPRSVTVDGETGRILTPGSVVPLIRNLAVFLLQYGVAVVTAMKLDASGEVAIAGQAVSGACAGYFLGWTIALLRAYRTRLAAPVMP